MKQPAASKVSRMWILLALSSLCLSCRFARAQPGQGFVNVDCGANETYTDSNDLVWTPDNTIIYAGSTISVNPPTSTDAPEQFSTIRYFPGNQSKYCYVLNSTVEQGTAYLVRASFWAGQKLPYATQVPNSVSFQLLLYADEWDDVLITLPQTGVAVFKEIYVVAIKDSIDVCVARKGFGMDIPFISSIVLRPLSRNMDAVQLMFEAYKNMPLSYMYRINYGAPSAATIISYLGDQTGDLYDRMWQPNTTNPISTTAEVVTNLADFPPLKVMQTAYQSDDAFELDFSVLSGHCYQLSVYCSELSPNVTSPGQRAFTLQVLIAPGPPFYEVSLDLFKENPHYGMRKISPTTPACVGNEGFFKVAFSKENGSTYGPIVCGLELLQFSDHDMPLGTNNNDVAALTSVMTNFYPSLNTWSGDPCLPRPYAYNWLTCSNDDIPSISTIDLSNKGLAGKIPEGLNRFQSLANLSLANNALSGTIPDLCLLVTLQALDLQGNNVSGSIPEFFDDLPILATLNLADNNFSGPIPPGLLAKVSSKKLKFSVAGNPLLCDTNSNAEYCKELSGSNSLASNGEPFKKKKGSGALVAGVAAAGVVAALIAMGLLTFCIVKRKKRNFVAISNPSNKQANTHQHIAQQESVLLPHANILGRSNQAHEFTFQAIKTMTRNFETMLGQGAFGPVYYGVLENGREVAVKLLAKDSRQGEQEFLNEVAFLCRVHHKNLVSLVGYCTESQLVLVYEFMANGTLCEALRGTQTQTVSWKDRLQIAVDAAEGLDYLHRKCNPSIIHRDVKSSNILLNNQFEGKISDFGISKAKQYTDTIDEGSQTFTAVQGSFGYLDPAYAETHVANHSIDVFAFGIVLFEFITGKPPLMKATRSGEEPQHILKWAQPQIEEGDISQLVDPKLNQDFDVSSMWKVIDIAMMCVEHDRKKRPTMSEIMAELKSALSMERQTGLYDTTSSDQQTAYTYTMDVGAR